MENDKRALIGIIDDDPDSRLSLIFLLDVLGHKIKSFSRAEDFINVEKADFACLIFDHYLPGMTGLELAQRLRAANNQIPIMLMSGDLSQDIVRRARQVGIDAISEKPVDLEALAAFIQEALSVMPAV